MSLSLSELNALGKLIEPDVRLRITHAASQHAAMYDKLHGTNCLSTINKLIDNLVEAEVDNQLLLMENTICQ